VKIGNFTLKHHVIMACARDVASTACACAIDRFMHRPHNSRMLTHPEVVVRAPLHSIPLSDDMRAENHRHGAQGRQSADSDLLRAMHHCGF
jgi:hypothetical protein